MNRNRLSGMSYEARCQPTRELLGRATRRRPVTLVIAHHDSILIRRLLHQLPEQEVVIAEHPQSDWDFGSKRGAKMLHSYLSIPSLKTVLLIGHSAGVPSFFSESCCLEGAEQSSQQEPGQRPHWLQRSGNAQRRIQHAKQHFIEQFQVLQASLEAIRTEADRELELAGLFYIAGSGVFTKYCPSTGDTEPLSFAERETSHHG